MNEIKEPDSKLDHLVTRVTENAKSIDIVLKGGASLAGIIVLLKLLGRPEFDWNGIKLSITNDAILIFFLLSAAHLFTAYRLIRSAHALWKANSIDHGKAAFEKVTETGFIFVRDLVARVNYRKGTALPIYKMKLFDPSALAAYGGAILLPFAIVPYDLSNLIRFYSFFAGAVFITLFNWLIGAAWIVALSELTIQQNEAKYHLRLEGMQRKQNNLQ